MSEPLYRIHWKSLKTGATGKGTRGFPEEESKRYADKLNDQDRDIMLHHWIEKEIDMKIKDLIDGLLIFIVFFGGPILAWIVLSTFEGY